MQTVAAAKVASIDAGVLGSLIRNVAFSHLKGKKLAVSHGMVTTRGQRCTFTDQIRSVPSNVTVQSRNFMSSYLKSDKSKGIPTFITEASLKTEADCRLTAALAVNSLH